MSKIVCVTAGYGDYLWGAQQLAKRMKVLWGIETVNLANSIQLERVLLPTWARVFCWDVVPSDTDIVIYLDADVFPVKKPDNIPEGNFLAVEDFLPSFESEKLVLPQVIECQKYFNAGIFLANRTTIPMFEQAKLAMWQEPNKGQFQDQSWMNIHVQRSLGGFTSLDENWHWMWGATDRPEPENPYFIHFCGQCYDRWKLLRLLYKTT